MTPAGVDRRIVALWQARRLGPARLAGIVGVPASTVHRVLVGHGVNRLRWMDRPTGRVIRRIETYFCGELVHIDVKKLACVPDGGGHKTRGRSAATRLKGGGYTHVHTTIDAYSRLAYSSSPGWRTPPTASPSSSGRSPGSLTQGITVEKVLTDIQTGGQRLPLPKRGPSCAPSSASPTDAPAPTGQPPTAKSNASTAPCSTNGPTPASGDQKPPAPAPLTAGSTATTITDTTPPSAAHPSAVSPTWPGTTPSRSPIVVRRHWRRAGRGRLHRQGARSG